MQSRLAPRLTVAVLAALTIAPIPAPRQSTAAPSTGTGAGRPAKTIVVCAPGQPGTTAAAQPTMDAFATAAAAAAGWPDGSVRAVYFETAEGGLKRLAEPDAALALVSLPFFLQHEQTLRLAPRLQAVQESGATETWGLVARRGRVTSAAALDGWEITGTSGYAPDFVRGPLLGSWGRPPASARITFTANVLSALRRAASGEQVAVLVDGAQSAAIGTLPFGGDLEIVARSGALPGTIVCGVGGRLRDGEVDRLLAGLQRLPMRTEWAGVLKTMRLTRFEPVDAAALETARRARDAVRTGRP